MKKYFLPIWLAAAVLLIVGTVNAQVTISGATKVASGSSSCYSASSSCATKTFCWSGSGPSSITPETSCGGGPDVITGGGGTIQPNTGGGGSSCVSPAMAFVVFPAVTSTTTAYIYVENYCSISNSLTVTIVPPPTRLTITTGNQNVTCSATPSTLNTSAPGGGDGTYSYVWLSSTNNSTFTAITGATASTYAPPAPTPGTTMYYEVQLSSFGMTSTSASASLTSQIPPLVPGTITPSTQAILLGTTPTALTVSVSPSGGACGTTTYTYLWYVSTDGTNYSSTGVTTAGYTPGATNQNTWYKRLTAVNGGTSAYSNIVAITTYLPLTPGAIGGPTGVQTYNSTATLTNVTSASNGNCGGAYTYQWAASTDGGNTYPPISLASGSTYTSGPLKATTIFLRIVSCGSDLAGCLDTVKVAPQLQGAVLTPSAMTITAGTAPGRLDASIAQGGNTANVYQYAWQSSADGVTWNTISGVTGLTYTPGTLSATTWYRIVTTAGTETAYSSALITVGATSSDWSFVRTRDILKAGVVDTVTAKGLSEPDVQQTTEYLDGLGRPIQTVAQQASPLLHDMVSVHVYDSIGREAINYLPYTASTADGNFKTTALADQQTFNNTQFPTDQYYYGMVNFESSPLNRPLTTLAPGNSWVGAGRGIGAQYLVATTWDSVHKWNIALAAGGLPTDAGIYANGNIYKSLTIDEQGHQVIEYKDLFGQVVLKKVQVAATPGLAHVGWLCTYYVYDDLHNLRFVISPRAVEVINVAGTWAISTPIATELCFRYEYDARNRMIIKKVPGAGEVHMVYDQRDRLVMSQDSNLRVQQQWLFTAYDNLDRADSTGLMTDPTNYNNLSYHTTAAMQSATYPNLASYTVQLMTRNFYDDYTWVAATSAPVLSAFDASHSGSATWFITGYNASPTYAVAVTPFNITRGMQTGVAKIVINSASQFLYTSMFYDDRGRVVQTSSNNYGLGKDTVTNQYNFSGKPLRSLHGQSKVNNTAQSHMIMTRMDYDQVNRLNHIYKIIDNPSSLQLICNMQYDELGRLYIKYLGNSLDSMLYSYNIRGWLTGINKNYVGGTTHHWFGMELAYDNANSVTGTTYANPAYNGNIGGVIWKSQGDGINRKYDFTYDDVNRLTGANFNQYVSGTWGKSSGGSSPVTIDFSVNGLGYDANGNIQSMIQQGFKIGGTGTPIDSLTYTYSFAGSPYTNKLSQVHDADNDTASVLGDFHYKGTKGSADYSYDGNGNLAKDNNKALNNLYYNYLNLLAHAHITGKGNIDYIYDAGGTKLQKHVTDSTTGLVTFTTYIGEFQYTRRAPFSNINSGSDTLQFISTEEGRARWAFHKHAAGDTVTYPEYDFVERDHLGNERVILTQERDTTQYIATMEAANRATENALFYNIGTTCVARTSVPAPGYPNDTTFSSPNDSVSKLNGNGPTVGPAIILKVMSGDIVDVGTQYYYNNGSYTTGSLPPVNLLNSLASGLATLSSAASESITTLTNTTTSPLLSALMSSVSLQNGTSTTTPQAYLNWILLDKQFRYVAGNCSGAIQVGAAGQNGGGLYPPLARTGILMSQSGYLYIYVSNATKGWDVFFDNISVHLYTRQLIEENHYYPFGLTMAGISDKAIKTQYAENKFRFNDKELQNKEFSDGTGLEDYDFEARMFDPQIGRWNQMDPHAEYMRRWSPYNYGFDNPARYSDPTGMDPHDSSVNGEKVRVYDPEKQVVVTPPNNKQDNGGFGNILWGLVDYIPFAGSIKQIGVGIAHGSWKEAGIGVLMLGVDVVSGGEGGELIRVGEEVVEHGLEVAVKDEVKEGAEKELEEIELHHSDPEFMEGDPNQELTPMEKSEHQELHKDLSNHLEGYKDATGKTMRPKRGNSGAAIRNNFSRSQRLKAMSDFYKGAGAKYSGAASDFFKQHPTLK